VAQEAVITGESVPQAKVAIEHDLEIMVDGYGNDNSDGDVGTVLSMMGEHRNSVLFVGTSIVHCTNDGDDGTTTSTTRNGNGYYYPNLPTEHYDHHHHHRQNASLYELVRIPPKVK